MEGSIILRVEQAELEVKRNPKLDIIRVLGSLLTGTNINILMPETLRYSEQVYQNYLRWRGRAESAMVGDIDIAAV